MKLIKITSMEELERLHDAGLIGNGTFNTGQHALKQGKPTFAGVADDYAGVECSLQDVINGTAKE